MNAGKYVVFSLDGERFGLPIEDVQQILTSRPVTRVPHTDRAVLGIFDLRGETMTVIDTRKLLGFPDHAAHTFIVIDCVGARVALTVDGVDRIQQFEATEIEKASPLVDSQLGSHIGRSAGELTILLDPTTLLARCEARQAQIAA